MNEKYRGLYRLRNGIVIEAWPEEKLPWWRPGIVKEVPAGHNYWNVGDDMCLLGESEDPITWEGGAHGYECDVIEKI